MLNYWWVTRPKRKLNSVPEVLATFAKISLDQQWQGNQGSHLSLEDALEDAGLKRKGERRDQTGGGGRTYEVWLESLGLIFKQESTGKVMLTLAGDAIMAGESPVDILKSQILKYQFPSAFSVKHRVNVNLRFKIRPFRFILKLLSDNRVNYLTEEELAKIIITEAENETKKCYEYIVSKLGAFRDKGDACLDGDFLEKYRPSKGNINPDHPYSHLSDVSNTLFNWLEYTQLIEKTNGEIRILEEKQDEVDKILASTPPFIDRPFEQEVFQRKFGLDLKHKKDNRNLAKTINITERNLAERIIQQAYIREALKKPVANITPDLVDSVSNQTGIRKDIVEATLLQYYPHGSIGAFMTEYFEMAFKGRDEATDFEKATVSLFQDVFGFKTSHVGPIGLTPDVLLLSDSEGYQAIIDNKAYSKYSISNDHRNRMIYNYIQNRGNYTTESIPLAFFSYIAGGFGKNFNSQIQEIVGITGVNGSGISVSNMIKLVECYGAKGYTHKTIRDILSVNRQVLLSDF